jgi:hypothetical protein
MTIESNRAPRLTVCGLRRMAPRLSRVYQAQFRFPALLAPGGRTGVAADDLRLRALVPLYITVEGLFKGKHALCLPTRHPET